MAKISKAQLAVLRKAHENTVYIDGVAKPGRGISRPTLDALRKDNLVRTGEYEALKGYPLVVTPRGIAVLGLFSADSPQPDTRED